MTELRKPPRAPDHDPHGNRLRQLLLAVLPVVLLGSAAAAFLGVKPYDPGHPADQIKLSWSGDPHTSVVILWHADRLADAWVRLSEGTASRTVNGQRTPGKTIGAGVWLEAHVAGLRPGTTYQYMINSGPAQTPFYQFRTEPAGPHAVRFDVFADQGDCLHYAAACKVMEGIAQDRPQFVLGAGDLSYANDADNGPAAANTWADDIMRYYSTWAPLLPTPGNHEYLPGDNIDNYKGRFGPPGREQGQDGSGQGGGGDYYSFTYGPVHVVALPERYINMKAGSRFQRWLEADLRAAAADPAVKWRIAFDHRPFYSTGQRHGGDHTYVKWVRPVLEKYHVDIVFSGHEHTYERTLPMVNGVPRSGAGTWRQGTGIAYVVTGGGGAPIYNDFGPAKPWDAVRRSGHEHVRVDLDPTGRTLRVTAVADDDGHIPFDEFVITSR